MADIRKTLDVFVLELPDPGVTLFEQITRQFTCFSKLPTELRLQIWKAAFPSARNIDLSGPCLDAGYLQNSKSERRFIHQEKNLLKSQFPVTLAVNQESRAETQKHYDFMFPKREFAWELCEHDDCEVLPLWLDPDIDSIFINKWMKGDNLRKMVDDIAKNAPRALRKIRSLDIYNNYDRYPGSTVFLGDFDLILDFPSLHTIYFYATEYSDRLTQQEISSFKVAFAAWFQGLEKRQRKTSISKVYFRDQPRRAPLITLFSRNS
jgi:hypothetical protein